VLKAYPEQPDQELLIEALRAPAPRRVQYVRWVRVIRFLLLNVWVVGMILAYWYVEPEKRGNIAVFSIIAASVFLYVEGVFRYRFHLLSNGEATVGVVVGRAVIQYKNHVSHQIRYRFWSGENGYVSKPSLFQNVSMKDVRKVHQLRFFMTHGSSWAACPCS
jgi:hypothetical protein